MKVLKGFEDKTNWPLFIFDKKVKEFAIIKKDAMQSKKNGKISNIKFLNFLKFLIILNQIETKDNKNQRGNI